MIRVACLLLAVIGLVESAAAEPVPIVYSTDLFHPHDDPDDHYDLACLFAIKEFDIRGIVLDLGDRQQTRCGRVPVEQMERISGRKAPWAIGLVRPLKNRADTAAEQPKQFQAAVERILAVLRESKTPVAIFTTGSCRDVAAAFNRQPELLREKVKALYINIGRGPNEKQDEWNVGLDRAAYLRLFDNGLPVYWCPCFGKDGYQTLFVADQKEVLAPCLPAVRNFFVYCLTKSKAEPLAFLDSGPHASPTGPRNMWCTAPMLHAAGRQIYATERGHEALAAAAASARGLSGKQIEVFRFEPIRVVVGKEGSPEAERLTIEPSGPATIRVFRSVHPQYAQIMVSCLKNLLAELGR